MMAYQQNQVGDMFETDALNIYETLQLMLFFL